jgi:hypothetical protein
VNLWPGSVCWLNPQDPTSLVCLRPLMGNWVAKPALSPCTSTWSKLACFTHSQDLQELMAAFSST